MSAERATAQVTPEDETPDVDLEPDDDTPDDDLEDDTPDPDPEAVAPALTEKEIEAGIRKLGGERDRHEKRLREIMGEDFDSLVACELCEPAIPGYHWPQVPDHETVVRVLAAVGLATLGDYKHDPESETCDLCDGHGELLTGSKVDVSRTRPCPKCTAKGYTTPAERNAWESTQRVQEEVRHLSPAPALAPAQQSSMPAVDAWTRPLGHEFYGMNPAYMTAEQRARDYTGAQ